MRVRISKKENIAGKIIRNKTTKTIDYSNGKEENAVSLLFYFQLHNIRGISLWFIVIMSLKHCRYFFA